jgi:DNA repair protein RadD
VVPAGTGECPDCQHVFPVVDRESHQAAAASEAILASQITKTVYAVRSVTYSVHCKRNATNDTPRTMRVTYEIGWNHCVSEWICLEHTGYARQKAAAWWSKRSHEPTPFTAEEAVQLAEAGALATPERITVRSVEGEPYDRIIDHELGPIPESWTSTLPASDIPF